MRPWILHRLALLGLCALLAACGDAAGPRWIALTRDFRPADLATLAREWEQEAGRADTQVGQEALGIAVGRALRATDWQAHEGRLRVSLPGGAFERFGRAVRLELAGATPPATPTTTATLAPGEYRYAAGVLELNPHPGWPAALPGIVRARGETGRALEGGWQARIQTHCGFGIPVWSGRSEACVVDLPAQSELSFRFGFDAPPEGAELRLRVTLDDATLVDERMTSAWREIRRYVLPLPDEARRGARLTFALDGTPGMGVFFTPVIGPRERGTSAARPWGGGRPDIVLVIVDTLRADMLAPYGGDPALAPRLNAFAQRACVYSEARSNAAWTLPSIASLLTGVYPGQHGATDEDLGLPLEHETVVEALAAAGYRTGAITDANFVSPVRGFDQGFEWFSEHYPPLWKDWENRTSDSWNLANTLEEARAFLAAEDGRPTFLLVHTYRVHEPYRLGDGEDPRANLATVARAAEIAGSREPEVGVGRAVMMQLMPELRAQYEDGVRDLDRKLGAFLEELEGARFFEQGHLVLTSDHGEALGENHDFGHGNHLWEVKLRVPLLVRGPGLASRTIPHPATLVDIAPTLAQFAGLERDPRWVGQSLLELDAERASFAWQLGSKSRQVALRRGTRKIITTPEKDSCEEAFDLATDPGESANLATESAWPAELLGAHRAEIQRALIGPPGTKIHLSPEARDVLADLGYAGDEE